MGSLFSSRPNPEPKPFVPTPQPRYYAQEELPSRPVFHTIRASSTSYRASGGVSHESYNYWNDVQTNLQFLRIHNDEPLTNYANRERRKVRSPTQVTRNPRIFNIQLDPYFVANRVVSYIPLSENDQEYAKINRMITNKLRFKVDGIVKIENPYLKKAYALKKEQKQIAFGYVEEPLLFHGTPQSNVESICKFNFNWRLCKAHKFGKGVSFSPNANYASNYSDKTYNKVMIVAQVMIAKSCIGNQFMELPDSGCDTSQKGLDRIVVVKYEDNEFCPLYKINYHMNTNVQYRGNRGANRVRRTSNFDDLMLDDYEYYYD